MDNKQNKTYRPTQAIQNNAVRGINLLKQSKSLSAESVLNRTTALYESITKSECSLDDVKKLYVYLVKAEESYEPMKRTEGNGLTAESAAFLAAGGTSALAWSRMILKQEGILKSYRKEITEEQINKEDELKGISLPVSKAVNEEKRLATFVVLEPQPDDMTTTDLHLDWYDEDTIEKGCHSFNKNCYKANILHMIDTSGFEFVESYITKADMIIDQRFVKKGSWLATIHVSEEPEHEWIWEGIKDGTFNGLSIQCMAEASSIDD